MTSGAGLPISLLEGGGFSGSTLSFRVERTGDISSGATIDYLMSGHGANPADTNDLVGGFQSGTITFQPGQGYILFGIIISGDADIEPDEQFAFNIYNPVNAVIDDAIEVATIRNDDFI